jgi:hypothetical protein
MLGWMSRKKKLEYALVNEVGQVLFEGKAKCVSAWGPGADRHSNRLIDFVSLGSML